ncbi:MAG: enoyl-CoA hydratase-related protein [bacterium]|nr:enoyl-CoA hydratase-related protein [bacterium]
MALQFLIVTMHDTVALVQLNRPKVLNALSLQVMDELVTTFETLDRDENVRCIVLTGDDRAFAAGADIEDMATATPIDMQTRDQFAKWDRIRRNKKPIIAAVNGFALGGGCELAMLCDLIICGENAKFGQPEISLGVMPGAGGTQRLTRAVGKALAMQMVLTGRMITAQEAYNAGLVVKVVPPEFTVKEALAIAKEIAAKPPLAVQLAKESINAVYETTLQEGLLLERKNFYLLFATQDQKEGMSAFLEKRKPKWSGK